MIEGLSEQEATYLEELRKHENEWVAVIKSDGAEIIVGSGADAVQAKRAAEEKGFADVILFKVYPFDRGYVPFTHG